jgi:hypothetical protein
METKTAEVAEVLDIRAWDGPHGQIFYHRLKLSNGEVGEVGKKKENAFSIGDSFVYTSEETSFGKKFKEVKEFGGGGNFGGGGGGRNAQGSARSFALSYAKDVEVAILAGVENVLREIPLDDINARVITRADVFLEWLEKGSVPQQTSTDTVSVEPEQAFTGNGDWANEEPKQEKPNYPPKPKPAMGGVAQGGKAVSPAQLGLLKKLTLERDLDVNHLIMAEWDDVESANDLSSGAASFLIETMLKGDQ